VAEGESERVKIVRVLLDMFRRRENDTPFAFYAEDVVWEVQGLGGGLGLEGTYRGHEGVRAFWRDWLGAWGDIAWEETSVTETEDGRVVVLIENQRNLGQHSGIWIDQAPYTITFTFRGNQISRVRSATVG
jgi:ketosteroid isomerase-like protein